MSSCSRSGIIAFLFAVLAGCAGSPPRAIDPPVVQAPTAITPAEPVVQAETMPNVQGDEPVEPAIDLLNVLTPPKEDLWARIRNGFALAELDSPLIKEHELWYASRPDYVARMTRRSQLYLFHIVEEVERRGLPTEIALLPMIESAFNPKAYSRSSAAGIWQFIPSTGKHFGLNQNWWYDGRRNVLAATNAALDYLQRLYGMFGSWELALAAYNCGEGTVSRAMAANRAKGLATNYLNLRLPPESRNYVPKLLAIKHIIADPTAFGLILSDLPNKPFFTTVGIGKHIDMALAARFADITLEEFVALNPAYNKPVITHNDNEVLLLPTAKADIFKANMRRYGDRQLHSWQTYPGKRGERTDKIAAKFGITVAQLHHLNSIREKRGKLKSAQLLLVPIKLAKPLPTPAQIATTKLLSSPAIQAAAPNRLMQGDILAASIPLRSTSAFESLRNENSLNESRIKTAENIETPTATLQTLDVPVQSASPPPIARISKPTPIAKHAFYTVKHGDTLYGIAQTFRIAVKDLMRWNNLRRKSRLIPGLKLKLVSPILMH